MEYGGIKMPRSARIKSDDSIYHIMVRSNGSDLLFVDDDDKDMYLTIFRKYMSIYRFLIYAYCLMDTHAHFMIDCQGADVTKFMHAINQCYAQYYNKKHERHGHVFWDRFKSIIVNNTNYLLTLSGYIHNNPSDIKGYSGHVEEYKYSSLGIYLGIAVDNFNIVTPGFVLVNFSKDAKTARKLYAVFVTKCTDQKIKSNFEFENEKSEYRSGRSILIRNFTPEQVADFVAKYTDNNKSLVHVQSNGDVKIFNAICVLIMRCLCNYTHRQICDFLGNITISQVSKLSFLGISIIQNDVRFQSIIEDLINNCKAA
jgi:REP element-mobilizing transposase RayT